MGTLMHILVNGDLDALALGAQPHSLLPALLLQHLVSHIVFRQLVLLILAVIPLSHPRSYGRRLADEPGGGLDKRLDLSLYSYLIQP